MPRTRNRLDVVRAGRGDSVNARPLNPFLDAWEQMPEETDEAYGAFVRYMNMGRGARTIRRVAQELNVSATLIGGWSAEWSWVNRVRAWDMEQDRVAREALLEEVANMARRHAQQSAVVMQALVTPATSFLQELRDDPNLIRDLMAPDEDGRRRNVFEVLNLLVRVAGVMPTIANVERLARGEPTEIQRHTADGAEGAFFDARRLLADPEAMTMANALFARLSSGDAAAEAVDGAA